MILRFLEGVDIYGVSDSNGTGKPGTQDSPAELALLEEGNRREKATTDEAALLHTDPTKLSFNSSQPNVS